MAHISFDEFWIKKASSINLSKTKHHPGYHYPGAPSMCPLCDPSLDSPTVEYRKYKNGKEELEVKKPLEITPSSEVEADNNSEGKEVKPFKVFSENPVWSMIFNKHKKKEIEISEIEEANFLKPAGVNGTVLVMPDVGFTRSLSIIECLSELERSQNKSIYEMYDFINGSGNSSIIACALALGKTAQELKTFWIEEWSKAYTVNFSDRISKSLSVKKKFGYSVKKARKILENYFKKGESVKDQYKLSDLKTEIYQPSIYGRLKEGTFYSQGKNPDMPIVDVLMDTAIDPHHFDAVETVKGKGVPLMIYDSELNLLVQNQDCYVTKVSAPVPHSDYGNLNNATSKELALPERDKNLLINKANIDSFVSNYSINRIEINCKAIPNQIHRNSTDKNALILAIEAGRKTETKRIQ